MQRRLAVLAFAAALLTAAGCGPGGRGREPSRILVLGFDGIEPTELSRRFARGELPAFARVCEEGASGELEVDPPLLSPVVWTTLATGRSPLDHGIGHFTARDAAGREVPVTSTLRRVPALWNLWSHWGKTVGVVGWWATWPAEPVRGVVVSDRVGYHFLDAEHAELSRSSAGLVHPPEREAALLALRRAPQELPDAALAGFVDPDWLAAQGRGGAAGGPFSFSDDLAHLRWAVAEALSHRDMGLEIWRRDRPEMLLVYFEATDSVSHLFGHLHDRSELAGELEEQRRRFGGAVGAVYDLADEILGEYLAAADERTTVVVISDHGFRLGALPADPSTTRDLRRVSDRYHRDRGVICLAGHGIRPGARLARPRTVDLLPTLVALARLPLSEDLPGRVWQEALTAPPAGQRIASYDGIRPDPLRRGAAAPAAGPGDAALLEQLRSLGYLAGAGERSPSGERNLAFVALRERRYREAARAFERLTRETPGDAGLHTGLASALAGLGREAPAREQFAAALALDPAHLPALVNRGLFEESLGNRAAAAADFRLALRVDPAHEPARRALARLGESAAAPRPRTAEEAAAGERIAAGNAALRRGDYELARAEFEHARRLVPDAAGPLHGLSNVAYLTGDRAAAARLLEEALRREPDNPLFRANLERLRRADGAGPGTAAAPAAPAHPPG